MDDFISYAEDCGLSYAEAAMVVGEFAKQRAPERTVEAQARDARYELQRVVESSPKEYILARFLAKTRVRYISWTYYPEYHVCSEPSNFWWCSIWFEEPNWVPVIRPDRFYLDDLFHDADNGKFWMREPYLSGLSESSALFEDITKKEYEVMEGTTFRKIDPRIIVAFKSKRIGVPEFTAARLDSAHVHRRPHYGSKDWQRRVELVPITYRKIRLG